MKRPLSIVFIVFIVLILVLSASALGAQTPRVTELGMAGGVVDQFDGIPIARVEIWGNKHISTDELMGRLEYTRVGAPFNRRQTRYDIWRLWRLYNKRGYEDGVLIQPLIRETIGGIAVVIAVEEGRVYRLGKLSVQGNERVPRGEIARLLGVKPGGIITESQVGLWPGSVFKLYRANGYQGTKIWPSIDRHNLPGSDEGIMNVHLKILEGERFAILPIVDVEFEGNQKVSTPELLRSLKYAEVGDQFNIEKLKTDMDRLRVLVYAEKGYLKAHFDDPLVAPIEAGLKVTLRVNEGRQYRVGNVTVEDNTIVSTAEIAAVLGLQPGEIARGPEINKGMEALKKLYGSLGYLEFNPDLYIDWYDAPGSNQGVADLHFKMDEGVQYRIHHIGFRGVAGISEESLRAILGLKDGEIFNQLRVDKSIEILNRLGLFEKAKLEDITVNTNEREGQADLMYNLRAKATITSARLGPGPN